MKSPKPTLSPWLSVLELQEGETQLCQSVSGVWLVICPFQPSHGAWVAKGIVMFSTEWEPSSLVLGMQTKDTFGPAR